MKSEKKEMKIIWHNDNETIDYISGNITDTENRIKEIKVRKKERKEKEKGKIGKKNYFDLHPLEIKEISPNPLNQFPFLQHHLFHNLLL